MGKLSKPKPTLLPGRLVLQHRKSCQIAPGKCGLCHWANKKEAWKAALKEPSWLHVTLRGKVARVGCSACFLADIGGPWASFSQMPLAVKLHHLRRHEACKSHQAAVAARCGADHVTLAPDLQVFRDALKNMRSGGSQRDGGPASDKKTQVRWCLSEAFLEVSRETLRTALSISMSRDEGKGRLLIRWRACMPQVCHPQAVCSGFCRCRVLQMTWQGLSKRLCKSSARLVCLGPGALWSGSLQPWMVKSKRMFGPKLVY